MSGTIKLVLDDPEGEARLKAIEAAVRRIEILLTLSAIVPPRVQFTIGPITEQES